MCGGPEAAGRAWEGVVMGGMAGMPLRTRLAGRRERLQGGSGGEKSFSVFMAQNMSLRMQSTRAWGGERV